MRLLIETIEKFAPLELIENIHLLNNCEDQSLGWLLFEQFIHPKLIKYKSRVVFHSRETLGLGSQKSSNPYSFQQAMKLHVAKHITTENYLVLDAKNHFIRTISFPDFFADDGRILTEATKYTGYLKSCLAHSLAFFSEEACIEDIALPTVTPYILKTDLVRDMLGEIAAIRGKNVLEVIQENDRRTEFLLYYAFLRKKGVVSALYHFSKRRYTTLFRRFPEGQDLTTQVISRAHDPSVYCFSIHADRFPSLSTVDIQSIVSIWTKSGTLSDERGLDFIKMQQRISSNTCITELLKLEKPQCGGDGKVFTGKNGRLFIDNDRNSVFKQHAGELTLDANKVLNWIQILNDRDSFYTAHRVENIMIVAPDTHAVYDECIPASHVAPYTRPILQILENAPRTTRLLYPLVEIIESRREGEPCHPTDSHWTTFGAFFAYQAAILKISSPAKRLARHEMKIDTSYGIGDLGDKFLPKLSGAFTNCIPVRSKSKPVWSNKLTNRGRMDFWIQTDDSLPTAILLTDSYGWKIQRFFAESFKSLLVIHSPNLEKEPILKYKPDVVIHLMAERFLQNVPNDFKDKSAIEFSSEKGGNKRYLELEEMLAYGKSS